jgi:hypothetical protein
MNVRERGAPRIRTMGQAEEIGYRLLVCGAGMLGVGILLSLTVVLIYLGAPLIVMGAAVLLGTILWMFAISRRMTHEVPCPHCHKGNLVLDTAASFRCDDCGEEIALQPIRTPVAFRFQLPLAYRRMLRALRTRSRRGSA